MEQEKPKEPRFKFTRELVRIAQNEGMTQADIARLCRTQQSVVSHWLDGSSKAKQAQIAPLLQRYGHKLNRTTSRLYLVEDEHDPSEKWEDTERAQQLVALKASMPPSPPQQGVLISDISEPDRTTEEQGFTQSQHDRFDAWMSEWNAYRERWCQTWMGSTDEPLWEIKDEIRRCRDDFTNRPKPVHLLVIEGPVVFRYTIFWHGYAERERGQKRVPVSDPAVRYWVRG